jgi:uncharacterized RDD family membrane protein YckC
MCEKCGASLTAPAPGAPATWVYAKFWGRVGAGFIDGAVVSVLVIIACFLIVATNHSWSAEQRGLWVIGCLLLFLLLIAAYEPVLLSSKWQATVGHKVIGHKITTLEGKRLSFWHALGRSLAKSFGASVSGGLSFLPVAFTPQKQSLHDLMAKTIVVDAKSLK